jgi:hypothetical protein
VANYLNPRGTGLFALILGRTDLDEAARWTCREQRVHYSKLIVGLSDVDVVQMVRIRTGGGDPAELVRQKIEDFRLGIWLRAAGRPWARRAVRHGWTLICTAYSGRP